MLTAVKQLPHLPHRSTQSDQREAFIHIQGDGGRGPVSSGTEVQYQGQIVKYSTFTTIWLLCSGLVEPQHG